jgi:hypothetical protein
MRSKEAASGAKDVARSHQGVGIAGCHRRHASRLGVRYADNLTIDRFAPRATKTKPAGYVASRLSTPTAFEQPSKPSGLPEPVTAVDCRRM